MKLAKRALLLLLALMFMLSCASFQVAKDNPYDTWSAKKKLTHAINFYAKEYDKYVAASIKVDLTEGQKDYLRTKRKALVGLDNVIEMLIPIVEAGGVITPELESQLMSYLTLLGFQPM